MTRPQEQIATQAYIRRTSANNGLPYRQLQQQEADIYDDEWPPRVPNSAIKYTTTTTQPPVIRSGNRRYVIHTSPPQHTTYPQHEEEAPRQRRVHWLLIFGIGMAAMLTLWVLGTILINWWNVTLDDWHYGRPRTYQIDAVVSHNNDSVQHPSHFIAINLNHRIEIIEFPAGDAAHAKVYVALSLMGDDETLAVVTLSFKDVNGDNKPDMIVTVGETHYIFINDNGQFRPLKAGEQLPS
jgi:hypothetical protein